MLRISQVRNKHGHQRVFYSLFYALNGSVNAKDRPFKGRSGWFCAAICVGNLCRIPFRGEIRVDHAAIGAGKAIYLGHFRIAKFEIKNIKVGFGIFG